MVNKIIFSLDPNKSCCVCFSDKNIIQQYDHNRIAKEIIEEIIQNIVDDTKDNMDIDTNSDTNSDTIYLKDLSLNDIEKEWFDNNVIPDDILVLGPCDKHHICIGCLYKIATDYENHPINENNSHISCPYPFEDCISPFGFKYIFDHHLVKKICKNEEEWTTYITYADKYAFPGYTIMKCPVVSYYTSRCNSNILIENKLIKETPIGSLIVQCDQNPTCLKKFCYYCHEKISFYYTECIDCKTTNENENPNVYNYYFNKPYLNDIRIHNDYDSDDDNDNEDNVVLTYNESEYLYLNKEITEEIAFKQICDLINDVNSYMICPICKISMYKTERCNSLSHHNIERCYACGRIGYQIRGLVEHWNVNGVSGCFRFNYDYFVSKYIPSFKCNDTYCHNHDKGDCILKDHQEGIQNFKYTIKKSYIYHLIISLLPDIRYKVYDKLYTAFLNNPTHLDLLPYKQTLLFLEVYKKHYRDYNEQILYDAMSLEYPGNIINYVFDKSYCIDVTEYINTYSISQQQPQQQTTTTRPLYITNGTQPDVSAWRNHINTLYYTQEEEYDEDNEDSEFEISSPLLPTTNNVHTDSEEDNEDTTIHIYNYTSIPQGPAQGSSNSQGPAQGSSNSQGPAQGSSNSQGTMHIINIDVD